MIGRVAPAVPLWFADGDDATRVRMQRGYSLGGAQAHETIVGATMQQTRLYFWFIIMA